MHVLRFHSPWVSPAKFPAPLVNRPCDWLVFACSSSLIGRYFLPYVTECKAEGNRSPGQGTRATSSAVRTRSLRSGDRSVSINDINMAVYMFVQPLFSNRDSYVTLNRIILVFLLYLFLTTGIGNISFLEISFLFIRISRLPRYVCISSVYTVGKQDVVYSCSSTFVFVYKWKYMYTDSDCCTIVSVTGTMSIHPLVTCSSLIGV